jgi:uncharacterized protein YcbX
MELSEVWRYPFKSMVGERVEHAEISGLGVVGDRAWAARDEVRGGIRGAKKIGGLMRLGAAYADGPGSTVVITLPDGSTTTTDDPDAAAVVSRAVDHEVTLWPLQPATDLDHYRRGAPDSDDLIEELNSIFGREDGEPLPDLSVFPPEILEFESPLGTYVDAFPVHLLTTSALRSVAEALPDSVIDVRRFRPNLVVDTGDLRGHPEMDWIDRRLRVGEVELRVVTGCPRCVMVTREVDTALPSDRTVLRHVVRELDQVLGVYAEVVTPGEVRVGDPVEVLG